MPLVHEDAELVHEDAELFHEHNGVKIYVTYYNQDMGPDNRMVSSQFYTTNPEVDDCEVDIDADFEDDPNPIFDIDDIRLYRHAGFRTTDKEAIEWAIERGLLTQAGLVLPEEDA